jgi:hypothetical protein
MERSPGLPRFASARNSAKCDEWSTVPTYTQHARESMTLRLVSEEDVESVLDSPSGPPTAGNRPDTLRVPGFDRRGRSLTVVVDATDMSRVVTVLT